MHKLTLRLEGVGTDSASIDLPDGDAFLLFVALKTTLLQGATASKRRPRRGTAAPSEDTADLNAPDGDDA